MRIKITADSTCDLTKELIDKHDIEIVPLFVVMDDKPYKDMVEVTQKEIFDYTARTGKLCHTSAVNVAHYGEIFEKFSKEYDAVIHINISSDISASNQNAKIAAEDFDNVYVIDSKNLSTGSGHLVVDAAIMAEEGMSAEEIVEALNESKTRLETSFVLDTLHFIYKGGRCSGVAALGANLLRLKPCIEMADGKLSVGKKYRGSLEKAIESYIEDRLKDRDDIDTKRVFITHTADDVTVEKAKAAVEKFGSFEEIIVTEAGCTISNHCGPGTLGILFYKKK